MNNEYVRGATLLFTRTGNRYIIIGVNHKRGTVTFAVPGDLEDYTTESIEDLEKVDVILL